MKEIPGGDGRKRVLVADDDIDVCTLLQLVLAPMADVTTVNDAEAALETIAEQAPFDVIISDFSMPGLDGLQFVEQVRKGSSAAVPILMISGHGAFNVGERARAAGVDAFLEKPFTLAKLRGTIESLLLPRVRYA